MNNYISIYKYKTMTNRTIKNYRRTKKEQKNTGSVASLVIMVIFIVIMVATIILIHTSYAFEIKNEPLSFNIEITTITNYSELDSCHYPVEGGCLTKSGTIATAGRTAACPRDMGIGTVIEVDGHQWVCEDWYNAGLSRRFDLFVGYGIIAHKTAIEFGVKDMMVKILK